MALNIPSELIGHIYDMLFHDAQVREYVNTVARARYAVLADTQEQFRGRSEAIQELVEDAIMICALGEFMDIAMVGLYKHRS